MLALSAVTSELHSPILQPTCSGHLTPWLRGLTRSGQIDTLWAWARGRLALNENGSQDYSDQMFNSKPADKILHLSSEFRHEASLLSHSAPGMPSVTASSSRISGSLVASSESTRLTGVGRDSGLDPLLGDLYSRLDTLQPMIPDRLSIACLEAAGVHLESSDPRLARLVSLAAQHFLTDILSDSLAHCRLMASTLTNAPTLSGCAIASAAPTSTPTSASSSTR
ncbi:unnamed protein product [Protopolystoma xenopodis]|uniref:Transcription initiation factor TFIID subunit 10 n=1 Tax=Protopolystoma xenopodis TaxID=117903 RepID=A0A3S5B9I0_9PLAT|nr:unnamed protein product [Protopolystoma xenopodis]